MSEKYALEMLVQHCAPGSGFGGENDTFVETASGIGVHAGINPGVEEVLQVLTNSASQPMPAAIRQQFVLKEKAPEVRTNCVAKLQSKGGDLIETYSSEPTGPYAKLKKFNKGEDSENPCPGLASDDNVGRSFLYSYRVENEVPFLYLLGGLAVRYCFIHFLSAGEQTGGIPQGHSRRMTLVVALRQNRVFTCERQWLISLPASTLEVLSRTCVRCIDERQLLSSNSEMPTAATGKIAAFRALCAAHGLTATHQRQILYEVMETMPGHPGPEEVYAKVKKRVPAISLATVYKNIHLFVEKGVLKQLSMHHGSMRVELNDQVHHHLVCSECKAVTDVNEHDLGVLPTLKELPGGFQVKRFSIDIIGICAACQKRVSS